MAKLLQKIDFRKDRDFGAVLGDSLKFLKQNFKSFFASVICIVGPFILVMGAGYGYMQTTILSTLYSNTGRGLSFFNSSYFLSLGVTVLCALLANILLSGVVYNYMGLYQEKPFGEKITVAEVAKKVWSNIGRLTISSITFVALFLLAMSAVVLMIVGIVSMAGMAAGFLIGFLCVVGILIYAPVLYYFIPASFYLVVRDGHSIFVAMRKVREYLSGNFWWTWLIMFVTLFGLGVLQTLFSLPVSIMTMVKMLTRTQHLNAMDSGSGSDTLLIVFYTLSMFLTYCTSSISHLISSFNFLSHEEKYEGKGLMSRIEEIN